MRSSPFTFATLLALWSCVLLLPKEGRCQSSLRTQVAIDSDTFQDGNRQQLQQIADSVASTIDGLIPGRMSEFVTGPILIYQVREDDSKTESLIEAPITISADFLYPGEPSAAKPHESRIALYGIEVPNGNHPVRYQRMIYQLAHELAHIKMGVRLDNYLVETFAMLVSQEVSVRLGQADYVRSNENQMITDLPLTIQQAIRSGDPRTLQTYWQSHIPEEIGSMSGRPFQEVGVILLRMAGFSDWKRLLGIGLQNKLCPLNTPPTNCRICPPDVESLKQIDSALKALGYRNR